MKKMKTIEIKVEDVAEPGAVASGMAGTGHEHGIETKNIKKTDGNNPHVIHKREVTGPCVPDNRNIHPETNPDAAQDPREIAKSTGDLIFSLFEQQDRIRDRSGEKDRPSRFPDHEAGRPGAIAVTQRRSTSGTGVPLFLSPHVIARQIKEHGGDLFRISVKQTHWHHYNVTVRTKPLHRELRGQEDRVRSPAGKPPIDPDSKPRDDGCGGAV